MAVRSTMAALITRVRLLINDTAGASQLFADQDIQDVLDASRLDLRNMALTPSVTYSGTSITYLDYYADLGDWEDDVVLRQFLTTIVSPATSEPIAGHWTFSTTTLPPLTISGKTYDVYRAAADLLERQAARWTTSYSISVDGQSLQRSQVLPALLSLAQSYRRQARPRAIAFTRTDLAGRGGPAASLQPTELDYMGSGDGR